ncbi:MAG: hypothetical protein RL210_1111, partial [Pseudomonadota bacterium]
MILAWLIWQSAQKRTHFGEYLSGYVATHDAVLPEGDLPVVFVGRAKPGMDVPATLHIHLGVFVGMDDQRRN